MNILERETEFSKVFLVNKESIRYPATLTALQFNHTLAV